MNQSITREIQSVMPTAYALGLFVSSASFFSPVQEQGPTGNLIDSFSPIAGLQDIPCMNAPESLLGRVSSDETRRTPHIEAERFRHVLLNAYFPALDTGFTQGAGMGWQATVDGTMYDFLGGEGDSQQQMTRCKLQLVSISGGNAGDNNQ
jgi:hypothetical protein